MNRHPMQLALRQALVISQQNHDGIDLCTSQWMSILAEARASHAITDRWAALGTIVRQHLDDAPGEFRSSSAHDAHAIEEAIAKLGGAEPLEPVFQIRGVELHSDEGASQLELALKNFDRWTLLCVGANADSEMVGCDWVGLREWTLRVVAQQKAVVGLLDRLVRASAIVPDWVATSRRNLWAVQVSIPSTLKVSAEQIAALSLDWMFALMRRRQESGIADSARGTPKESESHGSSLRQLESGGSGLEPMTVDRFGFERRIACEISNDFLALYALAASKADSDLVSQRIHFRSADGETSVVLTYTGSELIPTRVVKVAVFDGELPEGTKLAWRTLRFDLGAKRSASQTVTPRAIMDSDSRLVVEYPDGRSEFWSPSEDPE